MKKYFETSPIKVHYLLSYSPNLNPIERLWKWMKEKVIYNSYYKRFDDFKQAIFGFLDTLSTIDSKSALGKTFFSRVTDNFRPIGAPVPNS